MLPVKKDHAIVLMEKLEYSEKLTSLVEDGKKGFNL